MGKEKVTITLDRSKADHARSLVDAASTSEVVDVALDHLIRTQRLRRDLAAYRRAPAGADTELPSPAEMTSLDDDTDWEALYAEEQE